MSTEVRTPTGRRQQGWVLALTSAASVMVSLDALVVATSLSTIRVDLQASLADLQWTVNAYSLSFAVLLMTGAALGDRWGRRRMFAAGTGLFTLASAACAIAPGVGWLIAGRALQGAGAALVMPLALALLSAAYPPERRGWAVGIFTGVTGVGVLGGPLVGGAVTEGLAWQWIFWLNVPLGAIVVPLALSRIGESAGPARRLDLPGVGLATGASVGIVWAVVRGNAAGWTSAEVSGTLLAGLVLAAAFVVWERRTSEPMLPMRLFRSHTFTSGNAAGFLLTAGLFGAVFFLAQYLQTTLGHGPLGAGLRLLPWTATLFAVAPVAGALVDRIGERPFVVVGLTLQAVGMIWIALVADATTAYGVLVAPLVIAGCGVSMAMPAAQSAVVGAVPREAIGAASGTYSMMRQLGAVIGVAVLAAVFSGSGSYASAESFADGFAPAIAVSGVLSLVGALAGLGISGRPGRTARAGRARGVDGAHAVAQPATVVEG